MNITGIDVGEGLDATVVVVTVGLVMMGVVCCYVHFNKIICPRQI